MKRTVHLLGCAMLVVVARRPAALAAQAITIPTARLQSPVDTVRMNAFNQLQAAADDHRRHPDRAFTSFLADKDPRSASALAGGIGGSGAIDEALATFGDPAVPGLLAQFHGTDWQQRFSAFVTLAEIMKRRTQNHLSDTSAGLIQRALLDEILDPKGSMRHHAIGALMSVNNQEIRLVMEHVAATDTAESLHVAGQPTRYGVREAARAWLAMHRTTP